VTGPSATTGPGDAPGLPERLLDRSAGAGRDTLLAQFRDSFRQPAFWAYSSWLDIVTKYRRSRLGVFWLFVPPLLYVWGLGFFYSGLMGAVDANFICHVGIGFLLFRLMSTVITESSGVLPAHQAFILDGHVRLTDFVLRVLAKALFYFLMAMPVLAPALMLGPGVTLTGVLLGLLALPLVLANLLWIASVTSLVGARFPDVNEIMGNVFILGFVMTPIVWYAGSAPAGTIRGMVMRVNPMFHLIEIVRAPILGEPLSRYTLAYVALMSLGGWLLAMVLHRRYSRFVPLWL
jgi:ABC-type polysaccharide/polyol phosphate export permease